MTEPLPDARIPVIVAIGEATDRPADPAAAREPVALMADALRAADADGGGGLLARLDAIDLVGQVTWRYRDPVALLCERLAIAPARRTNASMGGETPIRLIHEAALQIAAGASRAAAIVGGEATNALLKARRAGAALDWTPAAPRAEAVRVDFDRLPIHATARAAGATDPVHIYPLYENALQAALGETPAQGRAAAAALWARYARVAAANPCAWVRGAPDADEIATPSAANRMIAFPYPKLMVANSGVNQAAAVIVASLAEARAAGVPDARIVHLWGGAAAAEPGDFLCRDGYDRSGAQQAVLAAAVAIAGGGGDGDGGGGAALDLLELYSCFPVVPRMAIASLAALGVDPARAPTVAGGLTFFGGPLNNYMTHAVCAMVRRLRAGEGRLGLLYGQGGVVSKHHALVVSAAPPPAPIAAGYSVQDAADAVRGAVPALAEAYRGPATVETYTIRYDRAGEPAAGIVVARGGGGERLIAQVPGSDAASMAILLDMGRSAIGTAGHVRIDVYGEMVWAAGPPRDRRALPRAFCRVERDDRLTIVTIDRPAAMNALHPMANAELAEIFDDFEADPAQWVAILTGAGDRAFSSGNDLKYTAELMARGEPVRTPVTGFAGLTARWGMAKPVIAAVNGLALGGGFEIALACDLIVAADTARFGLPEPKVGLAALAGGLHRLPRQIGLKPAMGMILTGRHVSAAEGSALGFVNEVVPAAELMTAARRWAAEILACSPMSIRASKRAVTAGLAHAELGAAFAAQLDEPAMAALFRSEDIREGPLAFAQKRPPVWPGK